MGRGRGTSRDLLLTGKNKLQKLKGRPYEHFLGSVYPHNFIMPDADTKSKVIGSTSPIIRDLIRDLKRRGVGEAQQLLKDILKDFKQGIIDKTTAKKIDDLLYNKWVATLDNNSFGKAVRPLFLGTNEALIEDYTYTTDWNGNTISYGEDDTTSTICLSGDNFRYSLIETILNNFYYNDHRLDKEGFLDLKETAIGVKFLESKENVKWEMDFIRLANNDYIKVKVDEEGEYGYRFTDKMGNILPFFFTEAHTVSPKIKEINERFRNG